MLNKLNNFGGRPPKFKSPAELWEKFVEYIEDVDANPWQALSRRKSQRNVHGNEAREMSQNERLIKRPYTIEGFCISAGISNWTKFKEIYTAKKGFLDSITRIEMIIRDNQITGAIIGEFNQNIVARLNGLAEVTKQEITGKDGTDLLMPLTIEIIDNRDKVDAKDTDN